MNRKSVTDLLPISIAQQYQNVRKDQQFHEKLCNGKLQQLRHTENWQPKKIVAGRQVLGAGYMAEALLHELFVDSIEVGGCGFSAIDILLVILAELLGMSKP